MSKLKCLGQALLFTTDLTLLSFLQQSFTEGTTCFLKGWDIHWDSFFQLQPALEISIVYYTEDQVIPNYHLCNSLHQD